MEAEGGGARKRARASAAALGSDGGSEGEGAERVKREVGRMVDSSQADDRRLIRLVRARRLLYARNNMPVASYYTQVKNLWDDVAQNMGWSVADVRRKWSHIRNSYSRHLRNEMHGTCTTRGRMVSRWYLADELEFLREHMATDMRPTSYSSYAPTMVDMELAEPAPEAVDVKPFLPSPWLLRASPPRAADDSCGSSAFSPDENASFFQFFRGIYGDYQELPPRQQRLYKRQCLTLLHELLDAEEGRAPARAHAHDGALNLSSGAASDDDREHKPHIDDCYILPNTNANNIN